MDARELRERAEHYRRTALLVTDEDTSKALLELAERYTALARSLMQEEPPPSDDRDAGHGRRCCFRHPATISAAPRRRKPAAIGRQCGAE